MLEGSRAGERRILSVTVKEKGPTGVFFWEIYSTTGISERTTIHAQRGGIYVKIGR